MVDTAYSVDEILKNLSIEALNKMQMEMLATFPKRDDILLLSPTGSGKTLGFFLSILTKLRANEDGTQVLILAPSRELAQQLETVFKSMKTSFKVSCCYGGHSFKTEKNNLIVPPTVLIGTPGRIADHIDKGTFNTKTVHTIVFDEFDKALEFGFTDQMSFIVQGLPSLTKRILTSATQAIDIPAFVGVKSLTILDYLETENRSEGLTIKVVLSEDVDKLEIFLKLIAACAPAEQVIVFCNHRESVERISDHLTKYGVVSECFHGGLDQDQRERTLAKFRNGSTNILVTTDLASRGLDITNIKHIVHYQKPTTEEIFIHRNGRTARMGAAGTAYVLLTMEEIRPAYLPNDIETLEVPEVKTRIETPKWITLFIGKGKKDKVNKMDVVGFLSKVGNLSKEEVGLIEVKDYFSYVAIERSKAKEVIRLTNGQKIKNKTSRIEIA
ncbi:MAG TPA: DEAD/DEAH box helicase [Chryseolinea sp.]|nr:DEAD/DEAH box helicase [Chryseolinea sp.]